MYRGSSRAAGYTMVAVVIGIAIAYRGGAGYYAHHDEILAALKRKDFVALIPPGP